VTTQKRRREALDDPLRVYRQIRTPMPPPQRAIAGRRRELEEEDAHREIEEER